MATIERIMKALANRRRMAIIKYLFNNKQASVGDVASNIKLSFKATSKHLGILFAADIVVREQKSLLMFYSLNSPVDPIIKAFLSRL